MTICSIQRDIQGVISPLCMATFYNGRSDGEAVQQILKKMGDDKFPLCLILQQQKNGQQEISPFICRWWEEPILKYDDPLTSQVMWERMVMEALDFFRVSASVNS